MGHPTLPPLFMIEDVSEEISEEVSMRIFCVKARISRHQVAPGGIDGATMSRARTRSSPALSNRNTTYVNTGLALRPIHHFLRPQPALVATQARHSRDLSGCQC